MTTPNPYAPPSADVHDIYDSSRPLELADRGVRLAAAIIDGVIVFLMSYLPFIVLLAATGSLETGEPDDTTATVGGAMFLAGFGIWCWLTVRNVVANGQSIAKKMLGIKVVRTDGSPASLGRIFWLRNVVNTFLSLVPLYWFIDRLFIFTESRQCLHDKLADTLVVKA